LVGDQQQQAEVVFYITGGRARGYFNIVPHKFFLPNNFTAPAYSVEETPDLLLASLAGMSTCTLHDFIYFVQTDLMSTSVQDKHLLVYAFCSLFDVLSSFFESSRRHTTPIETYFLSLRGASSGGLRSSAAVKQLVAAHHAWLYSSLVNINSIFKFLAPQLPNPPQHTPHTFAPTTLRYVR